ncbi:MAG: PepSY domain-containing protein [Alphaproteobacteria bacterium]|nr:PepSY domain-containing protein [Alphaproteobacteria bacterium]
MSNKFTTTLFASAFSLTGLLAAGPAAAVEPVIGAQVGTDTAAIERAFAESGYSVRKIEKEYGRFEIYLDRDGRRLEVKVDQTTGKVVAVELED